MAKISKLTPILYEKNETDFNHNGLGRLKGVVSYRIEEVLNGEFEAFFEYPASGRLADKIDNQMFIKARPNRKDEPTLFRIYEYDLDIMTGNYVIYARHKNMDDLGSNMILDVAIRGQTPNEAWNLAQSKALEPVRTEFYSDMTTTSSTEWTRRSLLNCVAGEEGSMIQYWGGEIKHGTNRLWLYRRRGQDNITTVRHGKNLDGLNATYSTKGLVTAVVPYHTFRVEDSDNEKTIYGDVVESQYINHYPHKYYDTVEYSEDDLGLEQEATESERIEALNKVAERWFTENTGVDLPSINMEIDLVDLSQTKEYEKFKDFEQIEIGDTVTVYSKKYNINVNAKVRRVVYNGLTDMNEEIEVGTVSRSIYDDYKDFVDNRVQEVREQVDNVRASANGKNVNIYGTVDPNEANITGQNGDNYFRQNGQEDEIWIFRDGMWHKVMDSADTTKNARAIEEQQKEIESAQARADEAVSEINTAVRNAGFTSLDDAIKSVQSRANTAFDTANDLIGEVSGYSQTVDGFNQTVNNYTNQVANFRSDVDGFSSTVASYSEDVRGYATQVNTLTNEVSGFNSAVANIDGQVSTLSNTIDGISSTVIGYDGRISAVEQLATGLQTTVDSKASQSQVTQLSDAYNVFVGGIVDRKNLLPGMESGGLYSNTGNEYDTTSYIRSPYIPVGEWETYIASVDGNPISFAMYRYSDIGNFVSYSGHNSNSKSTTAGVKYIRIVIQTSNPNQKFQLERNNSVTDYVPFIGDVSSAQISMLQDNINLRVTSTELNNAVGGKADKDKLITQINLSPDTALIQSQNILLDGDVTVRGTAWMDGAVLKDLSVDGAKIQDATIGSAKIANLDVAKVSGLTSNFVQSYWNSATGGSVRATGDGIVTTAADGSQTAIQNGVTLTRQPNGSGIGTIGYVPDGSGSPVYRIQTSWGAHFALSQRFLDTYTGYVQEKDSLKISTYDGGTTEVTLRASSTYITGRVDITNLNIRGNIAMYGNNINKVGELNFNYGSWMYDDSRNSNLQIVAGNKLRLYVLGSSSVGGEGGNEVMAFDNTYGYMYRNLSMEGNNVTNQSDARLKTDISTRQESSLEKINRFNFVDFRWIKDGRSDFGVIAQQVQQVAPELILEGSDGYLILNNSLMNMMTSHGLQELSQKHDTTAQLAESNEQKIRRLQQKLSQANRRIADQQTEIEVLKEQIA